ITRGTPKYCGCHAQTLSTTMVQYLGAVAATRWAKLKSSGVKDTDGDMPGLDRSQLLLEPHLTTLARLFIALLLNVRVMLRAPPLVILEHLRRLNAPRRVPGVAVMYYLCALTLELSH
ncbi:MAG: hypothetical protein ACREM3_31420, partial [Candidatus Rokuibacteriota bacterium]